ncbi:MAG: cytochrome c peroxidase, partial [Burkholderiales bacterium]
RAIKVRQIHAMRASIHAVLVGLIATASVLAGDEPNPLLGLPTIAVPADNPITLEKVALGKKLFMDRRLSPNNTLSCAMCHVPEQGFTQNELATSVGFEGKSVRRNAPTLLNVALHDSFQRDGAKTSLEAQVWGPLLAANEMANGTVASVVARIKILPDYRGLFEAAFDGRAPNQETIGQALASYERTLLAGDSRFDRWYFGRDAQALSTDEQAGFEVFKRANCSICHTVDEHAASFTDNRFHNTGIHAAKQQQSSRPISVHLAPGVSVMVNPQDLANVSEPDQKDDGRFEVTRDPGDQHAFKTPSLRNVALTPPYMHDGSMATLADVIDFYATGGAGCASEEKVGLSSRDRQRLIAFLVSLTGANVANLGQDARAAFVNY